MTWAQNPVELPKPIRKPNHIQRVIVYVVKAQKMYHAINDKVIKTYIISTAEKGTGNIKNSDQTPLGLHSVKKNMAITHLSMVE